MSFFTRNKIEIKNIIFESLEQLGTMEMNGNRLFYRKKSVKLVSVHYSLANHLPRVSTTFSACALLEMLNFDLAWNWPFLFW